MSDKMPLQMDIHIELSKPFVAYTTDYPGHPVILQSERFVNAHGDLIYYEERVLNDNPSKEEVFKVELANPQEEKQFAWGKTSSYFATGDTVEVSPRRLKDS
jgi:hypothetical protein